MYVSQARFHTPRHMGSDMIWQQYFSFNCYIPKLEQIGSFSEFALDLETWQKLLENMNNTNKRMRIQYCYTDEVSRIQRLFILVQKD